MPVCVLCAGRGPQLLTHNNDNNYLSSATSSSQAFDMQPHTHQVAVPLCSDGGFAAQPYYRVCSPHCTLGAPTPLPVTHKHTLTPPPPQPEENTHASTHTPHTEHCPHTDTHSHASSIQPFHAPVSASRVASVTTSYLMLLVNSGKSRMWFDTVTFSCGGWGMGGWVVG